jgi:hypothetical protein
MHSMVCDGYRYDPDAYRVHLKNWWNDTDTDNWCALESIPGEQGAIKNIYPQPSVGTAVGSLFMDVVYDAPSFPYRYFDQDAQGAKATFAAGHNLHFLPGVKLAATGFGVSDACIRFVGTPAANTRLCSTKGTKTRGLVAGIRICNGAIQITRKREPEVSLTKRLTD